MLLQQSSIRYNGELSFPHFYLCNYLPGSVGQDSFSLSLLHFKKGTYPDLEAWIDCALQASAALPISENTIILRALHHDERSAPAHQPASLDLLGMALASRFQCRYLPALIDKSRPIPEIKHFDKDHRVSTLRGAYRFTAPDTASPSYLLLDDIVTTGATLNALAEAILQTGSTPVSSLLAFSLAKADYDPSHNLFSHLQGKAYQLEPGSAWVFHEDDTQWLSREDDKQWLSPENDKRRPSGKDETP